MSAEHRIRRLSWQIRAADTGSALALRSALRAVHESSLLPALESAFDAATGGERVHLPRLELQLRVSHAERLVDELPALLAAAARRALAEAGAAAPADSRATARSGSRLLHYLVHGDLPWMDAHLPADVLRSELRAEAAASAAQPETAWAAFFAALPAPADMRLVALRRWLPLLADSVRERWLRAARSRVERFGEAAARAADDLLAQAGATPGDTADALHALALLLAEGLSPPDWRAAARQLRSTLAPASTPMAGNFWAAIESALQRGSAAAAPPLPGVDGSGAEERTGISTLQHHASPVRTTAAMATTATTSAPGDPLRAAGLVLLHPWLARLFCALGWIDPAPPPGQPFAPEHLRDALALLHWLASGRDDPLEFELGTAKLLLGVDPAAALPLGPGRLDDAAREEGGALLDALIAHWPALGRTSRDGLRAAFLQRGGLLYRQASGWLLRPQPEACDLLLDRLPWGIGLVHLPWRSAPLHVEWRTS